MSENENEPFWKEKKTLLSCNVALKGANDSLYIPRDTRIIEKDIQCVQNIKSSFFALKIAKL
jgi:uncharacterized 2Fe-2S/4Fe-4S cluster protein (DUF4445 family)